jgi:hypothetical protein
MHETIVFENKTARFTSEDGTQHTVELREFVNALATYTVQGLTDHPIVDNVRWNVASGPARVYIVELRPALRRVEWIDKDSPAMYGPDVVTRSRQLATPYIVFKIPLRRGQLTQRVETFYRTAPLSSLEGPGGELFFPNLLNVSPYAYECVCWFCTQYLQMSAAEKDPSVALDAVVSHLDSGKFNLSSEYSEGESGFSMYAKLGIDPRVADVDLWEEESRRNPRWVLDVPWKSTGVSVGQLIRDELAHQKAAGPPATAAAYGNILLRRKRPR